MGNGEFVCLRVKDLKARLFDELVLIAIEDDVAKDYSEFETALDVKNAVLYFDRVIQILQEEENGK